MHVEQQMIYTDDEKAKLAELRRLVESDPDLDIGTDDLYLSKYLSATNWDIEEALARIHVYFDFKNDHPEWISKRLPRDLKDIMDLGTKYILPKPDKEGRTIYVHKMHDAFNKFPNYFFDLVELDDLLFESALSFANTQRNGIVVLIDMKGMTRSFLKYMGPKTVKIVNRKNESLPFREMHFHVVNSSLLLSTVLSMVMPFLGKRIKDKLFVHGNNFSKLHKELGYENLPKEYGGPEDYNPDIDECNQILIDKEPYLKQIQNYKKLQRT